MIPLTNVSALRGSYDLFASAAKVRNPPIVTWAATGPIWHTLGSKEKPKQWLSFTATSLFGFAINVGSYKLITDFIPFFVEHKFMAFIVGVALGM